VEDSQTNMSIPKLRNKEKFRLIDKLLHGDHLLVHLNPNFEGVVIPQELQGVPTVTLKLSRLFRGGMELLPAKVEANLLFGSAYFQCIIPYEAIWGVTSESGDMTTWDLEKSPFVATAKIEEASEEEALQEDTNDSDEKPARKRAQLVRIK
jgi:hypothetical protein